MRKKIDNFRVAFTESVYVDCDEITRNIGTDVSEQQCWPGPDCSGAV